MSEQEARVSRVLVIAAHPDDIEFGAAGSAALWTDAGIEVTYCIVTDGAAGSNDPQVNYQALVERRRDEQMAAAACVGVTDVRFLGYPDGTMEPTLALRRDLTRVIRQVRPERVVITDPTTILLDEREVSYINHPDHRAVAEAALYAVFPSAETRPIFPELLEEGLEPLHVNELWMTLTEKPNTYVDITAVHDRKIAALLCHASQLDERAAQFVSLFDREAGKQAGCEFAEPFRVMKFYDPPTQQPDWDGTVS